MKRSYILVLGALLFLILSSSAFLGLDFHLAQSATNVEHRFAA